MKRAVLIDVSAVIYRAFYSLINMKNSKKEPTGASYGFSNMLLKIQETFKPDYIGACFDVKRDSLKRREEYAEYKEKRDAMPEDLVVQLKRVEEILDGFRIQKLKSPGYEADDVIGTMAKQMEKEGIEVIVVTGDKDLSQIVSPNIKIALPGKSETELFKIIATREDVIEQLGVVPEQIPDLFGLQGDASDGIPGIVGIGPKTAIKLILEYGNLEKIYENLDAFQGKTREKIETGKEMAFLSRKLATIHTDVPLDVKPHNLVVEEINKEILYDLFSELEFKTIIKKLGLKEGEKTLGNTNNNDSNIEKEEDELQIPKVEIIKNLEGLKELLENRNLAFYFLDAGIGFANGIKSWYVPYKHAYLGAENVNGEELFKLFDSEMKFAGYDIKKFLKVYYKEYLNTRGISIYDTQNIDFDVMISYYLLNPEGNGEIEKIILNYFGDELPNFSDIFGKSIPAHLEIEKAAEFAGVRAFYIFHLREKIEKELVQESLKNLMDDMEIKVLRILAIMELNGIKIEPNYFKTFSSELEGRIEELKREIFEMSGEEFNINSPKQLAEILFEKMGILPVKKTKTGFSTDVEVLEVLEERGIEIGAKLLDYRQLVKLKTTYVDSLPKLVDENNRIHTTFNQNGTATGRLSSTDPNLQNIPVKTEEGIKIRKGFVSSKGFSLISGDYSQIELRVLAELSRDDKLIYAYNNDIDLHSLTAMKLFVKEHAEDVTREERIIAKIVNFSIIYGKTPFGLAKEIKISPGEAKNYIDRYFAEYPGVRRFLDETVTFAEQHGYVKTYFGRKRTIEGINSQNKNIKQGAERMAVNTVVQGTAADIMKIAMIKVFEKIRGMDDIKMLLQVHDELVFEAVEDKCDYFKEILDIEMENAVKLDVVKLEAHFKSGKSWDETK